MLTIQVGHSYFLRFDRKQWERGKPYPPLATIHVAALLRRMGHRVSLFDAMLAEGVEDYASSLSASRPDVVLIYEDNFNYLTKMCLARMRDAACEMIAAARATGARVIVAGSDASDQPDAFLAAGADAVLIGEGIAPLAELVRRLDQNPSIDTRDWVAGLAGVASMQRDQLQLARIGAAPPDPRIVGHPAWDLVDVDRYRAFWLERHGYFSLNMAASRGCPFRCNWCAKPIWGNHYNRRSAEDVAAEMAYLKHTYRADHVWLADDIFGFHVDWVEAFAAHANQVAGSIPFTIQTRADLVSERMAAALSHAGCAEAWIGAESGSQRVLDRMNKGTKIEDLIVARERLGAHGIRVGFFIQLGYLGEELDDLLATRDLIARASPDDIGVSISYPLPGTRFYEQVKAQLGEKTHWRDSDDLAMMFQGAYDSEFYRRVRDLLHEQVVVQQWKTADLPDRHRQVSRALDARWHALIEAEATHRTTPLDAPLRAGASQHA
ncbi:anaerobic magnesium-protoporphyrin IX monomethyl ester cyclase [Dyella jiangningensis]|uniref:B12-binding domain-containing radical SAM protein n=1 Tax=Dyella sp. AtDHG13 TaxID=1938897 RepID=UPI000881CEB3|nr:radical SAM protein [Dyella sp. AtDHG13]PXV55909.1 anaerobic magnesium-protoporphyrin IX monomethyl ester cyclase [Dyella sp. AtDHG13]SDK51278.1 anaerobic magnesium-protoporphyrin IX monomethyl ester cyclase [Dyella jiangningensis]